jgi:hypothetical protein
MVHHLLNRFEHERFAIAALVCGEAS